MKEKYVLERFPLWFIFGEYKDGRVDISNGNDIGVGIPRDSAERLIAEHNRAINALVDAFLDGYRPKDWPV